MEADMNASVQWIVQKGRGLSEWHDYRSLAYVTRKTSVILLENLVMTLIKNGEVKTIFFFKWNMHGWISHNKINNTHLENRVNFHADFNRLMLIIIIIIISVNTVTPKCNVFRHLIHTCMNVIALENNIQPSGICKQMLVLKLS